MVLKNLAAIWAASAPALGNHLWQSTLFAIAAGLLTLILRKNHARARYGLWLAASVKFLIPFSLLVGLGSHLARPRAAAPLESGFCSAMEEISQPFTQPAAHAIAPMAHSTTPPNPLRLLPAILGAVWFCGFAVILCVWYARWRRVLVTVREAVPLREGREVEALRRLERLGGIRKRIELLMSPASLEPGILGIVRPVLVWPEGISERLDDAHLEAIVAHEVWHVRRQDNLAAAIHMVVEAVFWFYPLVWWLGARLVEERERACDEKVLELGSEPRVYAESILRACEFCLESPLACVSGITGAGLKERITSIMTERRARKLDFCKKAFLGTAGLVALALPVVFGMANGPQSGQSSQSEAPVATAPRFAEVSIKAYESDPEGWHYGHTIVDPPNEGTFLATDVTVEALVGMAYGIQHSWLIQGAPSWLDAEAFDVKAKAGSAVDRELRALSPDQGGPTKRRMLQALLADRFKLTTHRETKNIPVYALVIAKNGPRLQESSAGEAYPNGIKGPGPSRSIEFGPGRLSAKMIPMADLAELLSNWLGCTVLDQTSLKGSYDFTLQLTPDQSEAVMLKPLKGCSPGAGSAPPLDSSRPSFFTAIQEQLGLSLDSQKSPLEVLVIDHVERPSVD
jgi:uncharacterized protein (TIGR03435 family)